MSVEQEAAQLTSPEVGFTFDVPVAFHDLGMHLSDEQRWEHLEEVAAEVWSGGTPDQRSGVRQLYADVADAAAADGASYAGLCMFATEDDRVSSASLIVRSETIEPGEVEAIAAILHETLSLDPDCDVYRTEVEAGPALVQFTGLQWTPPVAEGQAPPAAIPMARVDAYLPLPEARSLLVMSLTTPSLPDLPHYVALLSELAETVQLLDHGRSSGLPAQQSTESAARVAAAFG
ncbi:hypothetical protein AB0K43_27540 [Kitasatospora sp. NPDC049258]|uniref:hypothetical protein n=1 Tax=Kitasatospora sp. NPDC049258 TaxID=3155394 RepID=UPI00343D4218